MYIINTSFFVAYGAHNAWLGLMNDKYIPFLSENGFADVKLLRVVDENINPEGFTYCLMVGCPDMEGYRRVTGGLFDEYKSVAVPMFGDAVQWFTTLLKENR